MKNISLAPALALIALSACANPYRANFNTTLDRLPAWMGTRFLPAPGKPRLIKSQDIRSDNWRQFEKGYVMVGFAKFDGPPLNLDQALAQAKAIDAEVVIVQERFTRSMTETVAVTQWPADETTEIREQSQSTGRRGPRQESRTTEIRVSRSPETVYLPKLVDYYEHAATFWRRIERPVFGALVQDLTDELKQKLQTNRGLVVRAVMVDSPAYQADLLKGDILMKIDGEPVSSARKFYNDVILLAGRDVNLSVLRGGKTMQRRLTLNP